MMSLGLDVAGVSPPLFLISANWNTTRIKLHPPAAQSAALSLSFRTYVIRSH